MVSQQSLEVARRAEAIYQGRLRALLEDIHRNEFVAIEPESGEYFLGGTLSAAVQAARHAYPDRLAYAMRIGHPTAVHLGVMST